MIGWNVERAYESIDDQQIADLYRIATEVFHKPFDEGAYSRLLRNGKELLDLGVEIGLDHTLTFMGAVSQGKAQLWIETRKNQQNYYGKHADFKRMAEEYLKKRKA